MEQIRTIETPSLLIAMPQVSDPWFQRSVVLLLEQQSEGSFGLIVNRRLELSLTELLDELGVRWSGPADESTWLGGPVQSQLGSLLFGPASRPIPEAATEVLPGIVLTQDVRILTRMALEPPRFFRLLLGYAGWGAGQLEEEIQRSDWLVAPASMDLVFSDEPESVWNRALETIGVRPEALPAWISGEDEEPN